jgi:subtilisin family serine protease
MHGTFVAGILCARRGSPAPGICPGCTLLVRPIFLETAADRQTLPSATPAELAEAIAQCVDAGARVLNLSVALAQPSSSGLRDLEDALAYAARRGVIVVAAAGNQGAIASSPITRHPWVIPVVACTHEGRPVGHSNLGPAVGRRGLGAPGDSVTSLGAEGKPITLGGTSVAAPFVTGAIALLWSIFPAATPATVRLAITQGPGARPATIVPPLLDAWAAYNIMAQSGR